MVVLHYHFALCITLLHIIPEFHGELYHYFCLDEYLRNIIVAEFEHKGDKVT